jgi:hypothetical protein
MKATQEVASLEAARRVLRHLVLHRGTVRVTATVPGGAPSIAVQPAGVLTDALRGFLARPLVRLEIARHMELGTVRFAKGSVDTHSVAATAAGFAHLQLCLLTPDTRAVFDERASVRQFDGMLPRAQAELFALFDVLDHASVVESVAVLSAASSPLRRSLS